MFILSCPGFHTGLKKKETGKNTWAYAFKEHSSITGKINILDYPSIALYLICQTDVQTPWRNYFLQKIK